jgi:phosphomannomutase
MSPLMISISGVRGIVGTEFNPMLVSRWAAAFSAGLPDGPIVLGRDSRPSGERLACAAADALQACGRTVWDLEVVPTPTVQVAVEGWHAAGGLILTASHNPSEWNALKFVGSSGSFLSPPEFAALRERVAHEEGAYREFEGWGGRLRRGEEALCLHREWILRRVDRALIRAKRPRLLLDCVHGAGGVLLPRLLRELGAEVEVLHEEPHGRFPRAPEPTGPALDALAVEASRRKAGFALAVDPDADRCAVAVPDTAIVGEEWTLPLVAAHLLSRRKGTVVTNLSTSTRLEAVAQAHGSRVERTPVGEANVVARILETQAVLGGEGNGGVIDPEIHLGRDAAVAAAWLLEAHVTSPGGLAGLASTIPPRYVVKAKLDLPGGGKAVDFGEVLRPLFGVPGDVRDGVRWSFGDGFVHIRPSATEPIVRVIAEASSEAAARSLVDRVVALIGVRGRG